MKKRYLFPCIMLVVCMIFTACATPSQNIDNSTPPATEQPTTAPDTEAPESSTPEPNAMLDEIDCERVLNFLEIEDENGVKNGEKINSEYSPLDHSTWNNGSIEMTDFLGFLFNSEGKLVTVNLNEKAQSRLVGTLDLDGCSRVDTIIVNEQDIDSLIYSSDLSKLMVSNCPELNSIDFEERYTVKFCSIENCPKLKWLTWYVNGILRDEPDRDGSDYYTIDAEAVIISEDGGRFDLLIDYGTDEQPDIVPFLRAVPDEGHEFLGWYNNNGDLISTDLEVRFFDDSDNPLPNFYNLTDSLFMFITARFSE